MSQLSKELTNLKKELEKAIKGNIGFTGISIFA